MREQHFTSRLKAELDAKYPTLTRGHVTVNATAIEENMASGRPFPAQGRPAGADAVRSKLYENIVAKGQLADSMAQRVQSSPDDLISELRLLEAQVRRAERQAEFASELAALKAKEADEAAIDAEKARAHASSLFEQLQRCRLLMDDDSMYSHRDRRLVSELSNENEPRDEPAVGGTQGVQEEKLPDKQPQLIVLELEGAIFDSLEQIPSPPLDFRARKGGGDVQGAGGAAVSLCEGALPVLETWLADGSLHKFKVAVLSRLQTPGSCSRALLA